MLTVHAAAAAGILLRGVRRLQRLPPTGEVSLSRLQRVLQSVPDQPSPRKRGGPQDVPRLRAGSVAIQMHRLQTTQTSFGIPTLQERIGNSFPHPLQELRDVHGVQALLHRPPLHGSRHEAVYEMRRSGTSSGVLQMQQDTRQENVP